jgi:cyclic beta-1,2-glucan synthetase
MTEAILDTTTLQNTPRRVKSETETRRIEHNNAIRAEYLPIDGLAKCGERLATGEINTLPVFEPFDFFARNKENEREILRVYRSAARDVENGASITPAAEWLLDNHYIIEEAIQEVRRDFPKRYYRELSLMRLAGNVEIPRTLALAWLYVAHTHSTVSRETLTALVQGFQTFETFSIGELWAIPSMVRFVLVENLARISTRVENSRRMRKWANDEADQLLRIKDPARLAEKLKTLEEPARDNTFAAQFLYRLRDGSHTSGMAIAWLEAELEKRGSDGEEVIVSEHNRLSSGNATMSCIIRSLREIDDGEWPVWVESVSKVDELLGTGTDYHDLDFGSRNQYRDTIEELAKHSTFSEIEIANKAMELAANRNANVGEFLAGKRITELKAAIGYSNTLMDYGRIGLRKLDWLAIAVPVSVLTLLVMAFMAWFLTHAGVPYEHILPLAVLFALPSSEGAIGLFNTLASFVLTPGRLTGYEYKDGIPAEERTLLVVPCLITNRDTVDELVRNLEVHYLANPHGEIYFALLSDWADAQKEETQADIDVLNYAKSEVAKLAARYAYDGRNRFMLLHRRRQYNQAEGCWMGWERKRGKLHELNLLLRGDHDTSFMTGANQVPEGVQYVVTLDADTRLMRDAVTKLVGKIAHPINKPVIDPKTRRVTQGYGILQPRVTPSLTTGKEASAFQRIFSANRGIDPYVFTVSDVYQDLTGEGTFTGKGLYHVDAFEAAIKGRIEENRVLSHDLLEGSLSRCALVTDVELVEDFPTRYEVESSRQHRWARGDWQLLPYIFDPRSGMNGLARWKMLDNLRRSLTPAAWTLAAVWGWLLMTPMYAVLWQIALILTLTISPTLSLLSIVMPRRTDIVMRGHFQRLQDEIRSASAMVALRATFIAHNAYLMTDAIIRALYRSLVSGKLLLEWRTAAQVQGGAQGDVHAYYRSMWQAPVLAALALGFAGTKGIYHVYAGLPLGIAWMLSPYIAWRVSQSAETEDRLETPADVVQGLRLIARRTWRYFETFVTPQQNFLPPDNFQETPNPVVAARTSPTNIGVYLLSVVSARDFGWIGFEDTVSRLEQTVATLERMQKFRGHLFNWYYTETLETLGPQYISAVDSGNLAGHLIAVSSQCRDWAEAPSAHLQSSLDGIADAVMIFQESLAELPDDRKTVRPLRKRIKELTAGFMKTLNEARSENEPATIHIKGLAELAEDLEKLSANLDHEIGSEKSAEMAWWATALSRTCQAHVADSEFDFAMIDALRKRLEILRDSTRALAFAMDFRFLFRPERRLLSIGYRVASNELDEACYDLLASEARLTSLFAVAKGDLPTEHWFKLGRQVVPVGSRGALVSWSGSMFEYLMPPLVMQERQGGVLNQTSNLVVKEQMNHARRLGGIPWGISEAAFNARDHELTYQYTNFGVPTLGLKRGLGQNAVIAPYASLLASQYAPVEAFENLQRLRKLGALGRYGFHDAVDFTPTRVPEGQTCAVVYNYMAHHHGMSIAAVANVAFNGHLRELFHSDPVIEAAELLLQEKAPREIPVMSAKHEANQPGNNVGDNLPRPEIRTIDNPEVKDRQAVFLSNGHYSLMLTTGGSGYSRWNGQTVARWKPDPTEDRHGTFIFLRDMDSGEWWSSTVEPRRAKGEVNKVIFGDDRAEFYKTVGTLMSHVEVITGTEHDAEGRRITITNLGTEDRHIELTSYLEPVLSTDEADIAHPLFSKMFIRTEIGRRGDVIRAWRNKRTPNDPGTHIAHLIADPTGETRPTEFETSRRNFIGRGRSLADATAFDAGASLSGTDGYTLDPILSLRRVVRIPAGKKVSAIFWTIAAANRDMIDQAIERYRHPDAFGHEYIHSWTRSQVQMRHVGASPQEATAFQLLGRYLVYPETLLRADAGAAEAMAASQTALWPLAISGDFPIFMLRINDDVDLNVAWGALRAQEYLRSRGVTADLVIVNERASSYAQDMQHALDSMCENARLRGQSDGPRQHIFAVRRDLMDDATWASLLASSRAVFHARNGAISEQIARTVSLFENRVLEAPPEAPRYRSKSIKEAGTLSGDGLEFWNGFGGFSTQGDEYVIRLRGGESTPHPWINVIAENDFGFHVAAEGGGYTWSKNSRDYPLTTWSNDPVIDRPSETFYITDLNSGAVLTPFASLSERESVEFETRHGFGYSTFRSVQEQVGIELSQTLLPGKPVKLSRLTISNKGSISRSFRIYGYVEWMLGNNPNRTAPFVTCRATENKQILFASNPYSITHSGRTAFFAVNADVSGATASRGEFIGRWGDISRPGSVTAAKELSGQMSHDGDPCAALAVDIILQPGDTREFIFVLGDSDNDAAAEALSAEAIGVDFNNALEANRSRWSKFLGKVHIETPDRALNHLLNGWLPYQMLSCRITARAAFYQASGAFGFRDQLQDSLALMLHDPSIARRQIVTAAGRQFVEGDVQHWWLAENGAGVRTHISDDIVWLAYALDQYVTATGDTAILDETVPFISGPLLAQDVHDSFFRPETSERTASIYEHAALGLDLALSRTGPHGLPLILGGDWNDGMNRVGVAGRGESVWLAWILSGTLARFIPVAEGRGDQSRADNWRTHLERLRDAIETAGWDGHYYRRAYYDDGTPLGSAESDENRIDSIAQSWSVLSDQGNPERSKQALDAALANLLEHDGGILRLFNPPYATTDKDPGYIRAYPPGIRENGGQYTHAGAWLALALAKSGRPDEAMQCLDCLLPIRHSMDREAAERYRTEPYAVAADIYSEGALRGQGGWSWYTGSAAWIYRAVVEGLLGIERKGADVVSTPVLPADWNGFTARIELPGKSVEVKATRGASGQIETSVNGKKGRAPAKAK